MSTLQETWDRFESFRDAFRAATQWEPEQLAQITEADVLSFPAPSRSERVSEFGSNSFTVLAFVSYLRSALADYPSVEALVDDLRQIARADESIDDDNFETLAPALPPLLPASPEEARQTIRQDISESISPILVDVTGSVDLRAVPDQLAREVRFVPLAHVRLSFDEAAAGGSDVVVFQATLASLQTLEDEIARLKHIFTLAVASVGDSIL